MCHNPPLVRDKPLGAPSFVKLAYQDILVLILRGCNDMMESWHGYTCRITDRSPKESIGYLCIPPHKGTLMILHLQGLYSLSRRTIHWAALKPRHSALDLSNHSEISQAPRQQCCQDACQISERQEHHNIQSRGTSRGLSVRRLTA